MGVGSLRQGDPRAVAAAQQPGCTTLTECAHASQFLRAQLAGIVRSSPALCRRPMELAKALSLTEVLGAALETEREQK